MDQGDGFLEPELPLLPVGATAVLLHLTYLRAQATVGRALADTFPTQADWDAVRHDGAAVESMDSLGQLITELRALSATLDASSLDTLATFGGQHYDRMLETVDALANRLGVNTRDLLSVLIYA